ncbi:sulfonate transport system ATP-binding protein (plasmid) [Agrobacterium tumefaciens]|nr:sulfonate transport system ATP-binding protein [Agrobacterium tumefaciens]KJX85371.1 Spermidine/putrescine import ATP-binding protein potA [Agrobacterium tumefaciens]
MTVVSLKSTRPNVAKEVSLSNTSAGGAALDILGLWKGFDGTEVLKGLSLNVPAGQFLSIVGRSGCGKSTLLRLIADLETIDGGTIQIDGNPLSEISGEVRMMFQDARLLPWRTVLQNIGIGLPNPWQNRARKALAEVGLSEHADKWPSQLSGGQRQRVALARALIHRPRLLLLDEPLGALDALTRLEMQDLIESIRARHGFTVLLVTHDVEEAIALGDRVIVMEQGEIVLELDIELARLRVRSSQAFTSIEEKVLSRVLNSRNAPSGDDCK